MRTYLQTLRRRKALILLIAVVMPVVAYIATQDRPDRYRSSTQVLLQPGSSVDELVNGTTPSNRTPSRRSDFCKHRRISVRSPRSPRRDWRVRM